LSDRPESAGRDGDGVADGEGVVAPGAGVAVRTPPGVGEPFVVVVGVGVLVVGVGPPVVGAGVLVVGVGPPGVGVVPPMVGVGLPADGVGLKVGVGLSFLGVGRSFEGVGWFVGPVKIPGATLTFVLLLETTRSIGLPVISTKAG